MLTQPVRTLADIESIEREMPWAQRVSADCAYDLIAEVARRAPDHPAIHFLPSASPEESPVTISYGTLLARMTQTANLLAGLGIGAQEAVSLVLPNLPQMHYLLWGGGRAAIVNPINPLLNPPQIAEILRAAGSRLLITTGPGTELWDRVRQAVTLLPYEVKLLQIGGDDTAHAESFDALLQRYPADRLVRAQRVRREDVAAYFHTGGTTGDPKLAQHTHGGQVFQAWVFSTATSGDDVVFVGLPMFHVAAAYCWGVAPMAAGATVVLLTPAGYRSPQVVPNVWKLIERYRATRVGLVPTVASALLNVPKGDADIGSVRMYACGAAPLSVEVFRAFQEYTGAPLLEGYGLTEAGGLTHLNPADGDRRAGSIGLRCPYVQSRVVKLESLTDELEDCAPEEIGAVVLKGPSLMPGYRQEKHNHGAFVGDGWLNTGDLARVDADGYYWLTGRTKDLIIRGGHNISSACIEDALHQHPAVALAAAVGRPDAYAGEIPIAYVTLKPGARTSAEELRTFALERVPERPAAPAEVVIVDEMPVTAVGKIYKPTLRHQAARLVLESALGALREEGIELVVAVGPDQRFGTLARVIVRNAERQDEIRTRVAKLLGPYVLKHEVVFV